MLTINTNGIASWDPVNPRSDDSLIYTLEAKNENYNLSFDHEREFTQDLFDTIQNGGDYNICVTARNTIGRSMPDCKSYTHPGVPDTPAPGMNNVTIHLHVNEYPIIMYVLLVCTSINIFRTLHACVCVCVLCVC